MVASPNLDGTLGVVCTQQGLSFDLYLTAVSSVVREFLTQPVVGDSPPSAQPSLVPLVVLGSFTEKRVFPYSITLLTFLA